MVVAIAEVGLIIVSEIFFVVVVILEEVEKFLTGVGLARPEALVGIRDISIGLFQH